jgi:hypothetical protein
MPFPYLTRIDARASFILQRLREYFHSPSPRSSSAASASL